MVVELFLIGIRSTCFGLDKVIFLHADMLINFSVVWILKIIFPNVQYFCDYRVYEICFEIYIVDGKTIHQLLFHVKKHSLRLL